MTNRVLVTGVTGFVAGHVVRQLLADGYTVRGTLRAPHGIERARLGLAESLRDDVELVAADLTDDSGWPDAAADCSAVIHLASPFPMKQPRGRESLTPVATGGALRVMAAARAADVEQVVMTSSMVAMMYRPGRPPVMAVHEDDWTDPSWRALTPYMVSKTRAERASWEYASSHWDPASLTTVNPGMVLGPAADGPSGTSLEVIRLLLTGAYPMVPRVAYPIVDVRDLARLHVNALGRDAVGGRRLLAASDTLTLSGIGDVLRTHLPAHSAQVPTREMPDVLMRLVARLDRSLKALVPDLGVKAVAVTHYVSNLTGVTFRPAADAVVSSALSLVADAPIVSARTPGRQIG